VLPFLQPEGVNISDLARLTHVRKQTAAASVEHLERAGYVQRRPDPNDRRATLVFMTPRGAAVRPVAVAAGRRVEDAWAQLIGREGVEDLRGLLMQLLEKLAESTPPVKPVDAPGG
jgi:DNA-binding MarR family transcriptional regulator